MKVLPWFALLFAYTAVPADAHLTFAGTPKIDLFSSARLIDTNQSQSLEAVSTADGDFRLPSYKLAGVYFITGNNGQTFDNEAKDNDFTDPTGDYCQRLGFPVSSCASGLFDKPCPYNDKFFNRCCEATYIYSSSDCKSPRKLSSETCGGKHRCYCDTAQYPFASCNDPQIKGNACTDDGGTRYATCVCPNPVSTPYGCETYYAAPCGSVCKKAYADNCHNRTSVSTPYGCQTYFSDCSSKCEKAYSDNCRNRNAVSAPYGCQQVYGDCQSKCEVAYADNCRNRTAVQTPYGCQTYFSDCSSKCQKAYADNCRNRTAVSIPSNASCSSYYSDCSSKCSAWTCNSGYKQSGSSCVIAANCSNGGYVSSVPENNICDTVTYQGLTCYTNCRVTVTFTEVWVDELDSLGCAGGPWIAPSYKSETDTLYTTFPRSVCSSSGGKYINKTSQIVPIGSSIKISVSRSPTSMFTLCKIARSSPLGVSSCAINGDYVDCQLSVNNAATHTGYHDYYIVWKKQYSPPYYNGYPIDCDSNAY